MPELPDECIDLVVTSPPYPMIGMWDELFISLNGGIGEALRRKDGFLACERMHRELDRVWDEIFRVLKDGGIACVNIGDAVRTLDGHFALYSNHSRIQTHMQKIGFSALPAILWRKQTNAPNKFMGSGMLPPGAYVTLEHEYVLIFRKGRKREFETNPEKRLRRESAFFWEERNIWFSDVWMDLKGTAQNLFDNLSRDRSGAFPFELPYRLITMFSVKGDAVLDPFLGTGTTLYASMAAGRNCIGYEIDTHIGELVFSNCDGIVDFSNRRIAERLQRHLEFVAERLQKTGELKYMNRHYRFPVMTRQETDLIINELKSVKKIDEETYEVIYSDEPAEGFAGLKDQCLLSACDKNAPKKTAPAKKHAGDHRQRQLFK